MIELIVGSKGTGKTKRIVKMINDAVKTSDGNIVCIEKSMNLTYELSHKVRLVDLEDYSIKGYDMLYGFIAGMLAGDYDIEQVYIDGTLRVTDGDLDGLARFLEKLIELTDDQLKFVITISADEEDLPSGVRRFL